MRVFRPVLFPWHSQVFILTLSLFWVFTCLAQGETSIQTANAASERQTGEVVLHQLNTLQNWVDGKKECGRPFSRTEFAKGPQQSSVCVAPEQRASQNWRILEPDDKTTVSGKHINDMNFVRGLAHQMGQSDYMSDDVGRTLGTEVQIERENGASRRYLVLRNEAFAKPVKVDGSMMDKEGSYYVHFLDVTNLTAGIEQKKTPDTSIVGEANIEARGQAGLGQKIQRVWHDQTSQLKYNYMASDEASKVVAHFKAGVTKIAKVDWSQVRCTATGTFLTGFDSEGRALVESRLKEEVRFGESSENPYLIFQTWREDLLKARANGYSSNYGFKVGTSIRTAEYIVQPYYGVVRYRSADDRNYAVGTRSGQEAQHMIGIVVLAK